MRLPSLALALRRASFGAGLAAAGLASSCGSCSATDRVVVVRTPDAGPNSASITGRVIDERDHPVTAYDLDVIPAAVYGVPAVPRWTVRINGPSFTVGHLPRGGLTLAVRTLDHRGGGAVFFHPTELNDGDRVAGVTVRAHGGLWLRGVVFDLESGAPVAGARIAASAGVTCRDCSAGYTPTAVTGVDGAFELTGLDTASAVHPELGMQLHLEADGYIVNDHVITAPRADDTVVARAVRIPMLRGVLQDFSAERSVLDGHVEVDGLHVAPFGDRSPFRADPAGLTQILLRVDGVDVTALGYFGAETLIERNHGHPTTLALRLVGADGAVRQTEQVVTMP